ncbi:MAG: hypothetical protein GWN00_25480, partial [Aliifodinibius sp.]|nr:hypothetical protein [Fodinibius sp.]NIV14203.1 hypothetical protein [Fodinibius sp.]NIY28030.1 hypothetical protein [Fodinibius sp.]
NAGEVIANIQNISFTDSIGLYTIHPPASFQDILPGDTVTYNFFFDVATNTAT